MADMVHDYRALETARQDAVNLVASDAFWKEPEYAVLRDELLKSGVMDGEKLS